jgi:hypothetical protein
VLLIISDTLAMVPDRHSRRFYRAILSEFSSSICDVCYSCRSLRLRIHIDDIVI